MASSHLHPCTSDNRIFEQVAKLAFTSVPAGRLNAHSAVDVASIMAIKLGAVSEQVW